MDQDQTGLSEDIPAIRAEIRVRAAWYRRRGKLDAKQTAFLAAFGALREL